jgi:hypothetical protein
VFTGHLQGGAGRIHVPGGAAGRGRQGNAAGLTNTTGKVLGIHGVAAPLLHLVMEPMLHCEARTRSDPQHSKNVQKFRTPPGKNHFN